MAYNDFDLRTAIKTFQLIEDLNSNLFEETAAIQPSRYLVDWLSEFMPIALGMNTEKARSESIIMPILGEAKRNAGLPANILSGVAFDVDRTSGLTGFCDYLISRSDELYYIKAPIVAVVEAKKEDLVKGLGQCAAEMVAIRMYNESELAPIPVVYGCVTSGTNWRFLKLVGSTLSIDRTEYLVQDLAKILGILVNVIRGTA
jgi:hypothetical protein